MMSDIHGKPVALEAVMADAARLGVDSWWVLGDLAAIGPAPCRTLELLTSLPNLGVIKGNTERYTLTRDRPFPRAAHVVADPRLLDLFAAVHGSFAWTRGALASAGWLDWLGALSANLRMTLPDGTRILGVHASPQSDDDPGITPQRDERELANAIGGVEADIVVAGHTHQPTDRVIGDVRAINLGSVSNPITDDLRASYVVLRADRHGHTVEHRRVAYDRERVFAMIATCGHPEADYIASFQHGSQVRFASRRAGAPSTAMSTG